MGWYGPELSMAGLEPGTTFLFEFTCYLYGYRYCTEKESPCKDEGRKVRPPPDRDLAAVSARTRLKLTDLKVLLDHAGFRPGEGCRGTAPTRLVRGWSLWGIGEALEVGRGTRVRWGPSPRICLRALNMGSCAL